MSFTYTYTRIFHVCSCEYIYIYKYINNCPTRCSTKQSIYYSASSLYTFRVSTTPIIRNTQKSNHSLRHCAATSLQRGQASLAMLSWPPYAVVHSLSFLTMGIIMPETCWDKRLIINITLVASCWFFSLYIAFIIHGHKNPTFCFPACYYII